MRKTGFRLSVRDLIIAVAFLGLMLGHFTDLLRHRPRRTRVTIRVFNRLSEDVDRLAYAWATVSGLIESSGSNRGGVTIAPGGMMSFRIDLPGSVDLTLSCESPATVVTSGPIRIDVGRGHPTSFDFDIRPHAVVPRWATGPGQPGRAVGPPLPTR